MALLEADGILVRIDQVTEAVEEYAQEVIDDGLTNSPDAATWSSPKAA